MLQEEKKMESTADMRPSFLVTFSRSQVAAFAGTVLDYSVLFLCTEAFHVWYVIATALGAFVGAVTNFLINRYWTFNAAGGSLGLQARRYMLVSGTSLISNTVGVFALTEYGHFHY